jgi:hypothetical protein
VAQSILNDKEYKDHLRWGIKGRNIKDILISDHDKDLNQLSLNIRNFLWKERPWHELIVAALNRVNWDEIVEALLEEV